MRKIDNNKPFKGGNVGYVVGYVVGIKVGDFVGLFVGIFAVTLNKHCYITYEIFKKQKNKYNLVKKLVMMLAFLLCNL